MKDYSELKKQKRREKMNNKEMFRDETLKLAMLAGAFAIRNNKKYNEGFFTSGGKGMPWSEAEKWLLCTAKELNPLECEIVREDN